MYRQFTYSLPKYSVQMHGVRNIEMTCKLSLNIENMKTLTWPIFEKYRKCMCVVSKTLLCCMCNCVHILCVTVVSVFLGKTHKKNKWLF